MSPSHFSSVGRERWGLPKRAQRRPIVDRQRLNGGPEAVVPLFRAGAIAAAGNITRVRRMLPLAPTRSIPNFTTSRWEGQSLSSYLLNFC